MTTVSYCRASLSHRGALNLLIDLRVIHVTTMLLINSGQRIGNMGA